ncbi:MAG: LacI family transcriptional regulator [Herminiimonas sp.]|nr:LacI family transcriptional regulator [Herminiimonas sp.]MDB5855222.1 LacI family transcriptional regulator [Herminiimonas sp.]
MKPVRPYRRSLLLASLGAAFLACAASPCFAADAWPTKPVTIVIPFAAGGTTDIIGREVGQKLSEELKQPVIIDNRPGAGGTLGASLVAHASPDGYTLFLSTVAHAMAPGIYKKLPYDFIKDLDPIGMVATTPNILVVNPSVPVNNVSELISYIKAHPNTVNYGSAGSGSTEHFSAELFRSMTGVDITHVPYKGGSPMMTDLIGGQIQMAIETSASATPYVRSGKVKALAVTGTKRSATFPNLPTMDEAGIKGYTVTTWFALMAPHGTPAAVEERASAALAKVLKDPALQKRFEDQGVSAGTLGSGELAGFIKSETARWGDVARKAGIKVD